MRRRIFVASATVLAVASVGGALAFAQDGPTRSAEPSISSLLGDEPAGLSARMDALVESGPYSITCGSRGDGVTLSCAEMADGKVISALKRGESVYGRTVIGFPDGADGTDAVRTFESTDLICQAPFNGSMLCAPVTAVQPTVVGGEDTFVFYKRHNVTFDDDGVPVGHAGEATVSLRVVE